MKTFMIYRNNVERDTMMQEEIDNEHLICISAVAPVKPAKVQRSGNMGRRASRQPHGSILLSS